MSDPERNWSADDLDWDLIAPEGLDFLLLDIIARNNETAEEAEVAAAVRRWDPQVHNEPKLVTSAVGNYLDIQFTAKDRSPMVNTIPLGYFSPALNGFVIYRDLGITDAEARTILAAADLERKTTIDKFDNGPTSSPPFRQDFSHPDVVELHRTHSSYIESRLHDIIKAHNEKQANSGLGNPQYVEIDGETEHAALYVNQKDVDQKGVKNEVGIRLFGWFERDNGINLRRPATNIAIALEDGPGTEDYTLIDGLIKPYEVDSFAEVALSALELRSELQRHSPPLDFNTYTLSITRSPQVTASRH